MGDHTKTVHGQSYGKHAGYPGAKPRIGQEAWDLTLLPRPLAGFFQRLPEKSRCLDFLALALLLALTGCDDPSAEEFVERAEAYRQERNFSASIIE